jgi:hypothetical protein
MTQRIEEGAERSAMQLLFRWSRVLARRKIKCTLGSREARAGRDVPGQVTTSWTRSTEPR